MGNKKALIAMSGGVDSSVAAYLMQKAGFDCIGAIMQLTDSCCSPDTGCHAEDNIQRASAVAQRLGIPLHVFSFSREFRQHVMEPFVSCYEAGGTPNPCVECNKHLKFRLLLDKALELGCGYIVTGHYVKIQQDPDTGRYLLFRADDLAKDQSYFLYSLTQEQLSHTLFPLSELSKEQVREIAEAQQFVNARQRDSQDICFIPDGDYVSFMESFRGADYPQGDFLDTDGKVVGRHKGAVAYTLGQRKGLGLAMGQPVYVCGKDMQANTVTVGPEEALFHTTLLAKDWNFFPFDRLTAPIAVKAKARYRHVPQDAVAYPLENGLIKVVFAQPQRALTPGQAVVLYQGNMVVGGGTITKVTD